MDFPKRLKAIDAKCARAHRVLNQIVIAEVTDPSLLDLAEEVRRAIADLTSARELLIDLAEESAKN